MREFIVENLTSAETISFAVIVLNNLVAMAAAFFVMLAYKVTYSGTAIAVSLIFRWERLRLSPP